MHPIHLCHLASAFTASGWAPLIKGAGNSCFALGVTQAPSHLFSWSSFGYFPPKSPSNFPSCCCPLLSLSENSVHLTEPLVSVSCSHLVPSCIPVCPLPLLPALLVPVTLSPCPSSHFLPYCSPSLWLIFWHTGLPRPGSRPADFSAHSLGLREDRALSLLSSVCADGSLSLPRVSHSSPSPLCSPRPSLRPHPAYPSLF